MKINISSHSNLKDKALYNGNSGVKQAFILSNIYHTYLLIDRNKREYSSENNALVVCVPGKG
jgi:hypothetical protein